MATVRPKDIGMKVLVVDDQTLVRRGLAEVLQLSMEGAEVTEAASTDDALEKLSESPHDVALVDIRMPGRDGLELLKEIRSSWPDLPVIMLTSFDNTEYVKTAVAEGAAGYLLKDCKPDDVTQAITAAVTGGGNVLSAQAVRRLLEAPGPPEGQGVAERSPGSDAGLTKRESDILSLLAQGLSNREISKRLSLSEKTVKAHVAAVFRKLGVTNRTQAAMAAVAMGLGPAPEGVNPAR